MHKGPNDVVCCMPSYWTCQLQKLLELRFYYHGSKHDECMRREQQPRIAYPGLGRADAGLCRAAHRHSFSYATRDAHCMLALERQGPAQRSATARGQDALGKRASHPTVLN